MLPRVENLPGWILLIAAAWGVCLTWPAALLVLFTDGMFVLALFGGAWGLGAGPAALLSVGQTPLQRRLLSVALGTGLLSTAALVLGMNGLLGRTSAWTMVVVGLVFVIADVYLSQQTLAAGGSRLGRSPRMPKGRSNVGHGSPRLPGGPREWDEDTPAGHGGPTLDYARPDEEERPRGRRAMLFALLLLPLAFPIIVSLCGATLPPGLVWQAEGNAYDVLEYHLQAPREYFEAGRIEFLPHNVYAQFPQQMEMLYLLLMHMSGSVYGGAIPSQILHALCGGLAILALAAWSRPGLQRIVVAVAAGSVPWIAYAGILAYVENGILFFAAVAAGLLRIRIEGHVSCGWRTALAAGLCAGLAGACKYPALMLVAASLGVAWAIVDAAPLFKRARHILIYFVAAALAFGPWLVRNWDFTGNPVYPFAYEIFGGDAWSPQQAEQWREGHEPKNQRGVGDTLRVILIELPGSHLFGAGIFAAALLGVVIVALQWTHQAREKPARASDDLPDRPPAVSAATLRLTIMLCLWSAAIFFIWFTMTHMPGRFAMPLIIPLAMLAGQAVTADIGVRPGAALPVSRAAAAWLAACFVAASGLMNNIALARECIVASRSWWERTRVRLDTMIGRVDIAIETDRVAGAVPPDGYVYHVGNAAVFYTPRRQHYTVVFNRDPWLHFCANARDAFACVNWLRTRDVTHVVFSWSEIERLRATYGFPPWVTPEWVGSLEEAGLRQLPEESVKRADGRPALDVFVVEAADG